MLLVMFVTALGGKLVAQMGINPRRKLSFAAFWLCRKGLDLPKGSCALLSPRLKVSAFLNASACCGCGDLNPHKLIEHTTYVIAP